MSNEFYKTTVNLNLTSTFYLAVNASLKLIVLITSCNISIRHLCILWTMV